MKMKKELCEQESQLSKDLRGVNFEEAKDWWQDKNLLVFPLTNCERHIYACIRMLNERYWTALISLHSGCTHLISVRLARKDEVQIYEKCCQ